MKVKVLKSESGVGHVIGNSACLLYPACCATVRDTPTARCVLQGCRTTNGQDVDKSRFSCPSCVGQHTAQVTHKSALVNASARRTTKALQRRTCPTAKKGDV